MSGISKMVEWLEKYKGHKGVIAGILFEARRLALEEAKEKPTPDQSQVCLQDQIRAVIDLANKNGYYDGADWMINMSGKTFSEEKPTAPASLVEELTNWCHKILDGDQEIYGQLRLAARWILEEILPRYRPSKTEDIVIGKGTVEVTEEDIFIGDNSVVDWFNENRLKNGELIFRKYEEGK